ncbi:MAG: hypothetical protein A2V45_09635 [Candidatus Aminicenantes bacterium RBG_19FT_COMBO_58_17]|jgi:hypothetical protein|nr:MAG: hypothetical protein A2V45_09635 [Candidatus Aminicenantes bacterium RBG_19FT_COMBO_58_17]
MVEELLLFQELEDAGDVQLPESLAVAEGQLEGGAFDVADQDGEVVGVDQGLLRALGEEIKRWGRFAWLALFYVVQYLENLSAKLRLPFRLHLPRHRGKTVKKPGLSLPRHGIPTQEFACSLFSHAVDLTTAIPPLISNPRVVKEAFSNLDNFSDGFLIKTFECVIENLRDFSYLGV